ncbi:hypothetical protein T552_03484 [Pneumocystis carinii B80]|uniref:CNH domain-containing protein n=1 Tax=Pneumocystis carinii (strain B80) TaxID=1408658 RepID=A0A0W4ZAY8_PNEC8|nr:hypothetical protein T552_03484 [Pneumocystis carinii B80]KTW25624.1 hypothetical protein T552_03484 [Pneumocystis carinii B80]
MALNSISYDISGIISIVAHDDRVISGTNDGYLNDIQFTQTESYHLPAVQVCQNAIRQIVCIYEAALIACLIDGQVVLFDLHSLVQQGVLPRSNGANAISLISYLHMDELGIPIIISRLVVVFKWKISIYSWHDSELIGKTIDMTMNQSIKTLEWINSTKLCICFVSTCGFADISTERIFKSISIKDFITLRPLKVLKTTATYLGYYKKTSKFIITRVSDEELLLTYNTKSLFMNSNGQLLERNPIIWSLEPKHIVYFHPYFIVVFDQHIEIRNIESYFIIQTFDIMNVTCIFSGKYLFISTPFQMWKLSNIPFDNQVDNLISQNRLDDALMLFNRVNSFLFQNKTSKIRYIKMMKAYQLFNEGKYKNSMILYSESSSSPIVVISMFPIEIFDCEQYLNDPIISKYINTSKIFLEKMRKKDDQTSRDSNYPEFNLKAATRALVSYYLNDVRRKLSILISCISQFQGSFQNISDETLLPEYHFTLPDSDDALTLEEMEKLLEIVDTTLFRAYVFVSPDLVGPLVRLQNKIQLQVAKDLLEKNRRYKDLIDYFFRKSLHRDALDLLKKLGQGILSDSIYQEQFVGISETIKYLKKLNNDYIEEIFSYIKWPLEVDLDFAMEVFLNDNQQTCLSKEKVYNFLLSLDENLATRYLEYLINNLNDLTSEFHDLLIMHYFKNIEEHQESDYILEKLLKLLINSKVYNSKYILEHLPKNNKLLEHKAIILNNLGQHKSALKIYLFEIKDFKKATDYCTKVYSMNNTESGDEIFLILLNLLLKPPDGHEIQLSNALNLLSLYRSYIKIETVASCLPLNIKISDIKLYLETSIQNRTTDIINGKILSSLHIANLMKYQNKLIDACNKKYTITSEKTCRNCHKRLGQSVLAIFPNDSIVHYGCQRAFLKTQNMPYTAK